jgi:hypothetical protein
VAELYAKAANWIADILGKYLPYVSQVSLAYALTFCEHAQLIAD